MATKKNAATKKATNGESASSRIRDFMKKNPGVTGNKEIAEKIGVKASQVAAVKAQAKKKAGRIVKRRPASVHALPNGDAAVEFIRQAGGIDNAISLLMTVKAIQEAQAA